MPPEGERLGRHSAHEPFGRRVERDGIAVYEVAVDWVDDPGSTADVVQTTPRSAAASATRAATSSGTSMVNLAMTRQL